MTGSVPASLGNLVYLQQLDLSNNSLSGSLSTSLLKSLATVSSLDLSLNQLTGSIPTEIG